MHAGRFMLFLARNRVGHVGGNDRTGFGPCGFQRSVDCGWRGMQQTFARNDGRYDAGKRRHDVWYGQSVLHWQWYVVGGLWWWVVVVVVNVQSLTFVFVFDLCFCRCNDSTSWDHGIHAGQWHHSVKRNPMYSTISHRRGTGDLERLNCCLRDVNFCSFVRPQVHVCSSVQSRS